MYLWCVYVPGSMTMKPFFNLMKWSGMEPQERELRNSVEYRREFSFSLDTKSALKRVSESPGMRFRTIFVMMGRRQFLKLSFTRAENQSMSVYRLCIHRNISSIRNWNCLTCFMEFGSVIWSSPSSVPVTRLSATLRMKSGYRSASSSTFGTSFKDLSLLFLVSVSVVKQS